MFQRVRILRKAYEKNNILELFFYLYQILLLKLRLTKKIFVLHSFTPIYLRKGTSDIPVFREIFMEKEYDIEVPHKVKYIVDGGANIGVSTLYFKLKYPEAVIIAVEPEKNNFKLLLKNTSNKSDITCLNAGIWFENVNVSVKKSDKFGEWGFQIEPTNTISDESIQSYSINNIMDAYNLPVIDILKLDIEGAERILFKSDNPRNWINKCKLIIIELHDFIQSDTSKIFFECLDKNVYYDYYTSGENVVVTIKGAR